LLYDLVNRQLEVSLAQLASDNERLLAQQENCLALEDPMVLFLNPVMYESLIRMTFSRDTQECTDTSGVASLV